MPVRANEINSAEELFGRSREGEGNGVWSLRRGYHRTCMCSSLFRYERYMFAQLYGILMCVCVCVDAILLRKLTVFDLFSNNSMNQ